MSRLSDNFIAHYKMNDIAATDVILDAAGSHNGAVKDVGGTATSAFHSVQGRNSLAQDLDGGDDYIEIADHADFTPALTPFSISAWVYMHAATNFPIVSKGVLDTDGEWYFFVGATGKVALRVFDESVNNCYLGRQYSVALTPYQNQWIHLVSTYNGGTDSAAVRLYLNGRRVDDGYSRANAVSFNSVQASGHAVWISRYNAVYGNGFVDNVMFFSMVLTATEVKKLYLSGSEILGEMEISNNITRNRERYGL